jgi:SAM-dependent methyltransferase
MYEMNYGCGTTVHFGDLKPTDTVLYVGVGGGLEALQFSYFTRRPSSVLAVDRVPEMLAKARENFGLAANLNKWFQPDFIKLLKGDALSLPVENNSVDVAAQNCLFNIFKENDLDTALAEMYRVLKPGGRLYMSDPITTKPIPEHLRKDERLRAMCLSGALSYQDYLDKIIGVGFGTIEIRARRPYRILDKVRYDLAEDVLLESIELIAYKNPVPEDGACVFAGETVLYFGTEESLDDGKGHIIQKDVPLPICQKTAGKLRALNREDLLVTEPTHHYTGGGCC